MVIEFDEMKKICWQTIQQLDHTNLDSMFDFSYIRKYCYVDF